MNARNDTQSGESVQEGKKRLRSVMRARQRELPEEYIRAAGESIQDRVLASERYKAADSIFVYISMENEPSTRRILRQALEDGKKVCVPKCTGRTEMLAVRIRGMDGMIPGAFGIPEPRDAAETAAAEELDLILVPCLAAAPDGRRLGHGAGYYDRFLQKPAESMICLCFSRMLTDDIPVQETDIIIPAVITELP